MENGQAANICESSTGWLVSTNGKCVTSRLSLKYDGTRAETRFRLSTKRTSPFKSAGASVQWTTGSRGLLISGSNTGYNKFRVSVKSTGYPLHSPVLPSIRLPASPRAIIFQLDCTPVMGFTSCQRVFE